MNRNSRFNFKLDEEERAMLATLAGRLRRSQSDTLRWLIRFGNRELARPAAISDWDFDPLAIVGDWEVWGDRGGENGPEHEEEAY